MDPEYETPEMEPVFKDILNTFESPFPRNLECSNCLTPLVPHRVIWKDDMPYCSQGCVDEFKESAAENLEPYDTSNDR